MAMKISEKLNVVSALLTLLLILFLIGRNFNSLCFNWTDYSIGFGTLFANLMISILSALGK